MIVLGANLADGPSSAKLSKSLLFCVSISKLVLLPLCGLAFTMFLTWLGVLPDDPVLKFVLMIEGATPSAMSLVILCQTTGGGEKEMSSLQFWVYISSALTLTLFMTLFLYVV